MAMHREPVRLTLDAGEFVISRPAAVNAAATLDRDLKIASATWEPHDWDDFQ